MSSPNDHTNEDLPAVDERLVAPGTRYEIDDGKLVYVAPADEPHGEAHGALAALLPAHCAPEYKVAIDMLTRTSKVSDIAPDASVYPAARDPRTGGRQLEEVVFELLATTRLSTAASKADQLSRRGVRRVFGIDLGKRRVVEWSRDLSTWSILPSVGMIEDRVFATSIPIEGLLDVASTDDVVVRAWRLRGHPAFVAEREEGREEGRVEGREHDVALHSVIRARFGRALDDKQSVLVQNADASRLERWISRAATVTSHIEIFEAHD